MMIRKTFFPVAATLLFALCAMATTSRVLILGDGGSEVFVKQALSDAGAEVTVVTNYARWDGVTPSATNFDVIVLLDGLNYGSTMQNAAAAAISAHVAGGGGLIMTEWTAYDAHVGTLNPLVAALLPVVSTNGSYSSAGTWNVIQPNHPIVTGFPASWSDPAGYSVVGPKPNTQVIARDSYYGTPMIVVSTNAGGPVVYLNHDMTYTSPTLSPYIRQLLVNAVAFLTGNKPQLLTGDILLLDDDELSSGELVGSSQTVLAGLRAAGLRVVSADSYSDWDGLFPNPTQFKTVVFLDGYYYGNGLKAGVSAVLTNFVGSGGGLVVTEWTASDVRAGTLDSTFALLMPVVLPAQAGFAAGATWTVTHPAHPVVAALPGQWSDPTWYSDVQPVSGATVLVSGPTNLPLVTVRPFGAGTVVHLNHTLTYDDYGVGGEAVRLLVNAATFAGGLPRYDSTNADVLVLGDGRSESDAIDALLGAGLKVSFGGRYDGWDGLFPVAANHSAILLLDGYKYGLGLQAKAEKALTNFVASGGGLVASEWTSYDVLEDYFDAAFGALIPVTQPVYVEGSAAEWTVLNPSHPILAGLPAQWSDGAGYSFVVAKPNATVLVQNTNGVPLVTVSGAAGGTVVHLNHDMTYTVASLGPEIRQLIVNAVTFAGHLQVAIRLSLVKPVGVTGDPMRLQFTPSPGYDYSVQYRDGLGAEFQWQDFPGGPFNTGKVDDFDHQTERFYRLKIEKNAP